MKARFGVFELDPAAGELRANGSPVKLAPQPARVLTLLVSRAGEMVGREELHHHIWSDGTFVDFERGLNVAIRQLRAALGDDAAAPRYIQTVVKRGYKFVAPVEWIGTTPVEPRRRTGIRVALAAAAALAIGMLAIERHPRIMLAVWPFENLSGDPGQSYIAAGMTEEMTTDLGRLAPRSLGVIALESVARLKRSAAGPDRAASALGVDYLLAGSIRTGAGRVRIAARLVRLRDGVETWAQSFDGPAENLVALEREVAQQVTRSLALELVPSQRAALARASTADTAAYNDFVEAEAAMDAGTEQSYDQVRARLQRAIGRDPRFAMAYAVLSHVDLALAQLGLMARSQACGECRGLVRQAIELDQTLPDARLALAVESEVCEDLPSAQVEALYRRALELNPSSVAAHLRYGHFLIQIRRAPEALRQMQAARELSPLSPTVHAALALALASAGHDSEAVRQAQKALDLAPLLPYALYAAGVARAQQGDFAQAIALLLRAVTSAPHTVPYAYALGMAYCRAGQRAQARAMLDRLNQLSRQSPIPEQFQRELSRAVGTS